jgi:hypothetical protein
MPFHAYNTSNSYFLPLGVNVPGVVAGLVGPSIGVPEVSLAAASFSRKLIHNSDILYISAYFVLKGIEPLSVPRGLMSTRLTLNGYLIDEWYLSRMMILRDLLFDVVRHSIRGYSLLNLGFRSVLCLLEGD